MLMFISYYTTPYFFFIACKLLLAHRYIPLIYCISDTFMSLPYLAATWAKMTPSVAPYKNILSFYFMIIESSFNWIHKTLIYDWYIMMPSCCLETTSVTKITDQTWNIAILVLVHWPSSLSLVLDLQFISLIEVVLVFVFSILLCFWVFCSPWFLSCYVCCPLHPSVPFLQLCHVCSSSWV